MVRQRSRGSMRYVVCLSLCVWIADWIDCESIHHIHGWWGVTCWEREGARGAGSKEQDIPPSSPAAAVPPAAGEEDDDEELDMAAASSLMPASLDTVMVLGAGFCARLEQTGSAVCGVCGLWFVR